MAPLSGAQYVIVCVGGILRIGFHHEPGNFLPQLLSLQGPARQRWPHVAVLGGGRFLFFFSSFFPPLFFFLGGGLPSMNGVRSNTPGTPEPRIRTWK